MEFYDAHIHFAWSEPFEKVKQNLQPLMHEGLRGMACLILGHYPSEIKRCLQMVPAEYHACIETALFNEALGFKVSTAYQLSGLKVFPYLDSRFVHSDNCDLTKFREDGFRGLKILYVPEDEKTLKIVGWSRFFGRSEVESQAVTIRMVEQAASFDWPIIFHANLKKYHGFVREVLETIEGHPVIIPHFGLSRRIMAQLIERFDHCYSDFSSLLPFMEEDPQSYLDFIMNYCDRILLGTDSVLGNPSNIRKYTRFVIDLIKDEATIRNVMVENFLKIHQFS